AIVGAADVQASTGTLDNSGGVVSAKTALTLDTQGGALANNADGTHDARIAAGSTAIITAGAVSNLDQGSTRASIAAQNLKLWATSAINTGTLAAGGSGGIDGSLAATTSGAFTNDGGTLQSQGGLSLQAQSLGNRGGRIVAASTSGATTTAVLAIATGG